MPNTPTRYLGVVVSVPLVRKTVPPVLVEQTASNQVALHLAKLLANLSSLCSAGPLLLKLVFGEPAMTKVRRRDPRSTFFGSCTSTGPAMQSASTVFLVCRTLARGPLTCLRTAPLPRPIRSEPPLHTDGQVIFCQHEYHPAYEVISYRKFSGASRWVILGIRYLHLGHDVEPTFVENSCPSIFNCK